MKCPLIKKACIKYDCAWYTHLTGHNPNTGVPMDEWGCAMTWLPILLVENSQQQRQTAASVDSFRNEMVELNNQPMIRLTRVNGHD